MNNLLLHESTARQLMTILESPPHALLICGQIGAGKAALAETISSKLLDIMPEKLNDHPYFIRIQKPADKQEISIEAVREVLRQLKLKPVIGQGSIRRIIFIEDAHTMSVEAQNALLKAIEEPPPATMFILSSLSDWAVLPTIASRSQKLKIGTVSLSQAQDHFSKDYDKQNIDSTWQLSGGSAGLMAALLREDADHRLKSAVEDAKKLLKLNTYDRLLYLDRLSADKNKLSDILEALNRILAALHRAAIKSDKKGPGQKLTIARRQVNKALNDLQTNASPRLIALNLALSLPV